MGGKSCWGRYGRKMEGSEVGVGRREERGWGNGGLGGIVGNKLRG